jgi:hypothetical protein
MEKRKLAQENFQWLNSLTLLPSKMALTDLLEEQLQDVNGEIAQKTAQMESLTAAPQQTHWTSDSAVKSCPESL